MLLIASCTLLKPGPILGPEVPGGVFDLMDRNLLSMCAIPKRMIFCSSLMLPVPGIFPKFWSTPLVLLLSIILLFNNISWIRTKVSFAIVRSAILCLRGSRSRRRQLDFVDSNLQINNIRACPNYFFS